MPAGFFDALVTGCWAHHLRHQGRNAAVAPAAGAPLHGAGSLHLQRGRLGTLPAPGAAADPPALRRADARGAEQCAGRGWGTNVDGRRVSQPPRGERRRCGRDRDGDPPGDRLVRGRSAGSGSRSADARRDRDERGRDDARPDGRCSLLRPQLRRRIRENGHHHGWNGRQQNGLYLPKRGARHTRVRADPAGDPHGSRTRVALRRRAAGHRVLRRSRRRGVSAADAPDQRL